MNDATEQQHWLIVAIVLFAALFLGITIPIGLFVVDWTSLLVPIYFIGFELLFIGLAYDLTEALLSLVLSPESLAQESHLGSFPSVALLLTVCDDARPRALRQLQDQIYPNYDVFVLDDSSDEKQRSLVDRFDYTVLRRGTRRGFKAGNLNHWIDLYAARYKYVVVLDSDSLIPDDFITQMVKYAEHRRNQHIAVFQSKIHPWNGVTDFARIIGVLASLRMYLLERVANRTDTMLSWGHNNLIRTKCILQVGGFHEYVTAEDTALSLMLSARGYRIKLVDILSYDTEPQDAFAHVRRTVRWAKQTVEVFRLPWRSASLRLKLLLCYHLYNYLIPTVYLVLLMLAAWTFKADDWSLCSLIRQTSVQHALFGPWFLTLVGVTLIWIIHFVLRLVLARRVGIRIRDFLLNSLLSTSLMYFLAFPVGLGMLQALLGAKIIFSPTNANRESSTPTLQTIINRMLPSLVYGGFVLTGIALRNHYLVFSLNSLWLLILLASPVVIWLFHTSRTSQGANSEI